MIQNEVVYICDCCGKRHPVVMPTSEKEKIGWESMPKSWMEMPLPFGLCCDKCMAEFMGVYERIHAPEKARQMYEEEGYGR